MSPRALTGLALAAVLSVTALSGCELDGPEPTPAAAELTTPGTELGFGETARVTRSGDEGRMSLKVVDVVQGSAADLAALLPEEDGTPYYLEVEVTPESGELPIELKDYLGLWAEDVSLTHVSVFTDFAPCQEEPVAVDELDVAQRACLVYVAEDGSSVPDTVYFDNHDDYSAFDGNAVVWKRQA